MINDRCVHNCLNDRIQPMHRMPLQSDTMRSNNLGWIPNHKREKKIVLKPKPKTILHLQNPIKLEKFCEILCSFPFVIHEINIFFFLRFHDTVFLFEIYIPLRKIPSFFNIEWATFYFLITWAHFFLKFAANFDTNIFKKINRHLHNKRFFSTATT